MAPATRFLASVAALAVAAGCSDRPGGGEDAAAVAPLAPREELAPPFESVGTREASAGAGAAPLGAAHIPLVDGLVLVSVLHFPDGDRENVVTVQQVTDRGAHYTWRFVERRNQHETKQESFRRFVRSEDLAGAMRLHTSYKSADQADYPGYTAFSLSTRAYEQLLSEGEVPFSVTQVDGGLLGGAGTHPPAGMDGNLLARIVRLRGTLALDSRDEQPFSLLLNGQRVFVPLLRLKGRFGDGDRGLEARYGVLADAAHPLILRMEHAQNVWQMVRIDLPAQRAERSSSMDELARKLAVECRGELPGVYFDFGTAELHPSSHEALAHVAGMLLEHADWRLVVEGHTDAIGSEESNRALSQARAEAVRSRLAERHGIPLERLDARGFGAVRPRETNDTVEGRARNRRVELVRACDE